VLSWRCAGRRVGLRAAPSSALPRGSPQRKYDLRTVFNAVRYVSRTGGLFEFFGGAAEAAVRLFSVNAANHRSIKLIHAAEVGRERCIPETAFLACSSPARCPGTYPTGSSPGDGGPCPDFHSPPSMPTTSSSAHPSTLCQRRSVLPAFSSNQRLHLNPTEPDFGKLDLDCDLPTR
jgi:hypothetical protein